jgi:DNA-binding CsgD family transcriptional regulator
LHRTTVYNEGFRLEGVEDALEAEVSRGPARVVSIVVFRSSRRWSRRDLQVFNDLLPHLEQAIDNARRFGRFGSSRSLLASLEAGLQTGLVLLNRDGEVIHWSPETRLIFRRYFSWQPCDRARLPLELERWVRQKIRMRRQGIAPSSFSKAAGGSSLEFSLSEELESGHYLLMVSESRPPHDLSAFGLTPREIEVLRWITEGKTNDEIATILGVSFFTVKTQVKSIFRRLGVETRTAAAAMMLRERQVSML